MADPNAAPRQQPQPQGPATPAAQSAQQRPNPAPSAGTAQPASSQNHDLSGDQAKVVANTRALLDNLALLYGEVAQKDRATAQAIRSVVQQGADPAEQGNPMFRHQLAFAVQDTEKTLGEKIPMSPELREEMTDRAGSAPGLHNERMLALMRSTGSIADKSLVTAIRSNGFEVGQSANQTSPAAQSTIETLENKVRLAARTPEPGAPSTGSAAPQQRQPGQPADRSASSAFHANGRNNSLAPANLTVNRSALDVVLDGLRGAVNGARGAPWDAAPTPMAGRLQAFEEKLQRGKEDKALVRAEQSARAAIAALQALRAGEAATVLGRIREAAKTDRGGIAGVLSEMRQGGRYADLRGQFNNALETGRGVTAAYDKAASALAQYGSNRSTVDTIIAKRPDAINLSAKFEALDAEIGEAASSTPSRRDGKSMVDDLAKHVAELLSRAVDRVRRMFSHNAAAATTHPGPAPSPGP